MEVVNQVTEVTIEIVEGGSVYVPLTTRITDDDVSGTYDLDHNAGTDWKLELTSDTTLTDSNMPNGTNTAEFTMKIKGESGLFLPSYWALVGDDYDGSVWNFFAVQIHNGNVGEEEVTCFISNL